MTTTLELELSPDLSLDDWTHLGQKLTSDSNRSNWLIGDWANFGEKKYGKLKEFADANPLISYQTIRNIASVCTRVEVSSRRDNLAWSFHEAVAKLKPKEQDKWLQRATDERLSVGQLRTEIRTASGESSALKSEGPSIKLGSKHCDDLISWLQSRPPEFWTPERKAAWRKLLQPIVTFWEGLA